MLTDHAESREFKITEDTEIRGNIATGHHATVYFKMSKEGKVAEKVVISDPKK